MIGCRRAELSFLSRIEKRIIPNKGIEHVCKTCAGVGFILTGIAAALGVATAVCPSCCGARSHVH